MNTKKTIYTFCLLFGFLFFFVSCNEEDDLTEVPYLFRPIGFDVTTAKTVATFKWFPVDSAISYTVEISEDSLEFSNIIISDTVTTTTYVAELGGSTRYSARVKANARNSIKDSKFNQSLTFKTPSENILEDYNSFMFEEGMASINWLPGASATRLVFKADGKPDVTFTIDESEKVLGSKICSGLTNGSYTIELYNDIFKRGEVNVLVEGDYFVRSGDNLATILAGITKDSAVVVIRPGIFSLGGVAYSITKSIKIRGLFADSLSIICMEGASATAKMFDIASTAKINYIDFENLEFSGYMGGGASGSKIGYFVNQSTSCDIDKFIFKNCIVRNFGNTPFRLQTTSAKAIEALSFEGCRIFDIGYTSVYAIVNNNAASNVIRNISFKNSTMYNFAGSLILHTSGSVNSIIVENCSLNEITTSGAGTTMRYMIDLSVNYNADNGLTIKNCIFGSTPRPYTEGVRSAAATNKMITGSYFTSDFNDNNAASGYSIKASLIEYTGTSIDLFKAPLTGDFGFKDASFAGKSAAGDPRWK